MKFGLGQSVPRKEDPRMITGGGCFADDVNRPGQLYLAVFRSPYAHGVIADVDVVAARVAPGVRAVYVAADLAELGSLPCRAVIKDADGQPAYVPRRPILAEDNVCFAGQAVAAVVAETPQAARDALELIELEVDELGANVDPAQALARDTAILHQAHGSNLCVHYQVGDRQAVTDALAASAYQVSLQLDNNRVAPSPLEPRSCLGEYIDDQYVLHNPSQGPFAQQGVLANAIFKTDLHRVRVISLDTGGGFGIRGEVHPEACLCLFAARQLGAAVKYSGERGEMFVADSHGRDNRTTVTAGFDGQGKITALHVETIANLGAYCTAVGPLVPTMAGGRVVGTVYCIPQVLHSVRPVFTNTMPVAAYRGAGRPEACYVMERLFEAAAQTLSIDSIELRKRNFVQPQQMPYTMASGVELTSGEFAQTLDLGLAAADWQGYGGRLDASRAVGRLRGRGIGYYVESSGGGPEEQADIQFNADGSIDVIVGTFSHGQGHRTTFSQILSERLGVDFERINIIQGDTEQVKFGGGTGGSRSSQMGGVAILQACELLLEDARGIAADLLQCERQDVAYHEGSFVSSQNTSTVSLAQVAEAALDPQFGGRALRQVHRYNRGGGFTFPNGCHIAEVEIDPQTGVVEVARYTAVDDCGRVINPLLAGGQVHGGVAMGIGQALYEQVVYDDSGQLLTGSFMDYTMPRASQLPDIGVQFNEVHDPNNPLGVKGIGEGGACGAPPAVVNAVLDALRPLGVESLDMPLTSEKIWRALRAANHWRQPRVTNP